MILASDKYVRAMRPFKRHVAKNAPEAAELLLASADAAASVENVDAS
jgi:hypothetical protein